MLFKKIISEGLAHNSYIFGSQGTAVVIDPRRDIEIYLESAYENDLKIQYVLETHRHEDFVSGSTELAKHTDAEVFHADLQLDYQYGKGIKEGQSWLIGDYDLEAISTPGHTTGSFSFLLKDADKTDWILFSGDTMMAGDLGRTDLVSEKLTKQMTETLYNSLVKKILPLHDGVIICPAHGSGSVCGSDISEREWTSLGIEKRTNPKLQFKTKKEFIKKNATILDKPPYFKKMEELNLRKNKKSFTKRVIPLSVDEVAKLSQKDDYQLLDVRSNLEFSAAHIENSIYIWEEGLASFAGWFLSYDKKIILICEYSRLETIKTILGRLGFDNVKGYLSEGLFGWHREGKKSSNIATYNVNMVCEKLDQKNNVEILDIRDSDEINNEGKIKNSIQIPLVHILENKIKIPTDKTIFIFCGTGLRSMIAASLLKRTGFKDIAIVLGGLSAWNSSKFPVCENVNENNEKE
ncbi:MAG: MBL fold metallo-hydrolase [Candidatus Cloacimonetes bacterium]|nr:MBL fold metallo-hydrolase [Candidatus Cloacimonadota bacterium]